MEPPPIRLWTPPDRTPELLAAQRRWVHDPQTGLTTLPTADLQLLWDDRADWFRAGESAHVRLGLPWPPPRPGGD